MVLEPKPVLPLYVTIRLGPIRERLRVVDYLVLVIIHWSCFFLDFSCEPFVPTFEAEVGSTWVTDEVVVVDSLESLWAKPASLFSI